MTRTLAERNAEPRREERGKYTLETRYAVGHNGSSLRGTSGAKMHLLVLEVVVEDRDPKPGTYKLGDTFRSSGICGGNGQHTAHEVKGMDVDAVTCSKCLTRMGGR